MNLAELKNPFREDEIEWRIGQCGKKSDGEVWATCLAYIEARALQDRLDEVCGPENWKVEYEVLSGGEKITPGIVCKLSIKADNNKWVTKQDGADQTDTEAFKGGISSAFKRAGSVWGAGRYLYGVTSSFAKIVDRRTGGSRYGKTKDGTEFHWLPPGLPAWALPPRAESPKVSGVPQTEDEKGYQRASELNSVGEMKFSVGQYTGTTILSLYHMDRDADFKYAKKLHSQIGSGKTDFHKDYQLYYYFCKDMGVFE